MKYFFLFFTTLIFFKQSFAQTAKTAGANIKLIYQLFDALNAHDTAALKTFCDDSIHIQSPNWEGLQTGLHAIAVVYQRYFSGTPDLKYAITNIISTNDDAVVEYTFTGTFTNPEPGTPEYMRDKKYSLKACSRMDIVTGKITNSVTYFDQVSFLRQVGFFDQKN